MRSEDTAALQWPLLDRFDQRLLWRRLWPPLAPVIKQDGDCILVFSNQVDRAVDHNGRKWEHDKERVVRTGRRRKGHSNRRSEGNVNASQVNVVCKCRPSVLKSELCYSQLVVNSGQQVGFCVGVALTSREPPRPPPSLSPPLSLALSLTVMSNASYRYPLCVQLASSWYDNHPLMNSVASFKMIVIIY